MAKFSYVATDSQGERVQGTLKAPTSGEARYELSEQGLVVLDLQAKQSRFNIDIGTPRVKSDALMHMSRQFAAFIRAGIPILDAIAEMADSSDSRAVRRVLTEIQADLQNGSTIGDAFARHPRDFPNFYVGILRSAEMTGELDVVLDQLAGYLERNNAAKGQIKTAMLYPTIVAVLAVVVVVILAGYVIPKFKDFFASLDAPLPAPTQIMLNVTDFLVRWWWVFLLVAIILVVGYLLAIRTLRGRRGRDRMLLKLPVVGVTVRYALIERFTRLLGAMVDAGVPLPDAMQTATDSLNNLAFQEPLRQAWEELMSGAGLSGPISKTRLFPGVAIQMIRVGESTGTLDRQLQVAAEYYADELDGRVKRMTTLIEPIVIVAVGLVVGFVAIALVSAMYGIFRAAHVT